MKNIITITFLKQTDFTSLLKWTVYLLNKSSVDLSGSKNPKGENYKSNIAEMDIF